MESGEIHFHLRETFKKTQWNLHHKVKNIDRYTLRKLRVLRLLAIFTAGAAGIAEKKKRIPTEELDSA